MLRRAYHHGARAALQKFGFAQPSLNSVGIRPPTAPGLPPPGRAPKLTSPSPKLTTPGSDNPAASLGQSAAKAAADVGLGASSAGVSSVGAIRGIPADEGRRQRSNVDRTFQQNEDFFASSSMPAPGVGVSP